MADFLLKLQESDVAGAILWQKVVKNNSEDLKRWIQTRGVKIASA